MLKSFLIAAIAANFVVLALSYSTEETSDSEASGSSKVSSAVKEYMSANGYGDDETNIMERLVNANSKLTCICLWQKLITEPDINHVTTLVPFIEMVTMALLAQTGSDQAESMSVLNLNSVEEAQTIMPIVGKIVKANAEEYIANIIMRLYGNKNYPYSSKFISQNEKYCNISSAYVDYASPEEAATEINDWIKDATNGEVENILGKEDITSKSGGILIGHSGFETEWNDYVTVEDADDIEFYVSETETKTVPAIHIYGEIIHAAIEEYDATLLSVALKNDCSMKILYSNQNEGLANLLYAIRNTERFNKIMFSGETQLAHIYMPNNTVVHQVEDFIPGTKMSGLLYSLMVRNETSVCDSVYEGSDNCGYLSNMMHDVKLTIKNKDAETTERRRRDTTDASSDSTDSTEYSNYTVQRKHVTMIMCPLMTPHMATLYTGGSN